MYLLLGVTGKHEEGNQGLEATHLTVPLLQQDGCDKAHPRVVGSCYLPRVSVVIPGHDGVNAAV